MSDLQINSISRVKQFGEMSLDFRKMELCRAGQPVQITLREFKVLKFLVCRPGIVVSRQRLLYSLWPKRKLASCRTVDNCIAKLRQKIESNPDYPAFIRTVHGVGYKFVPQQDSHSSGTSLLAECKEAK
ncbi:MAG: winged helix-turn-helix domain-containing protein [Candidatus Sulfotelmatobacter sp.]